MSESAARVIINQKSLPWGSTGKSLWHEWRAIQREEGNDPADVPAASFEKFVCERVLSEKHMSEEEEEEDSEDMVPASMTYTDAGSSFESMIGNDLDKANADALSYPSMSLEEELRMTSDCSEDLLKQVEDGVEEEEEEEEKEEIIHSSGLIGNSSRMIGTRTITKNKYEEEADEGEDLMRFARKISESPQNRKKKVRGESEEDLDQLLISGQVMSESLIGKVLQDVLDFSKKPVHALHKMVSKSGQQLLKDQISSCCLKKSKMNDSCPHFKKSSMGDEDRTTLDAASNILSLLMHAERDDSISSNISKESTRAFEDIRNMAYHISTIPSSERTFAFPSAVVAASYEVKQMDKTPVHKINSLQLTAIEKNYLFSQSTAFGTWGVHIIQNRETPQDLLNSATTLSKNVALFLEDPKKGKTYDYEGIYVGYQAVIGYLIGLLRHLHKNLPKELPTRKDVANVSSDALEQFRKTIEQGTFIDTMFNFEARGMVSGKKKRGRKIKKLARKGMAKATKLMVKSTLNVLKTVIFNASEEYKKALNEEEQKTRVRVLPAKEKQVVVLDKVLGSDDDTPGYVHAAAMKGAKRIGLHAFGKTKLADEDLFLSYDRTILAITATLGKMVTSYGGKYVPINDSYVKNNIIKFLVDAQRDVAGESKHAVRDVNLSLIPIRSSISSSPSTSILSDEEHDALVESMISIRDFISNDEKAHGYRRTGSSPEWEFVVIIPHSDKLNEKNKEKTYDNIHQYIFESKNKKWTSLPDSSGSRTRAEHDGASNVFVDYSSPTRIGSMRQVRKNVSRQCMRVSETFVPEGAEGKLARWKQRKNVNVRVRRSLGIM